MLNTALGWGPVLGGIRVPGEALDASKQSRDRDHPAPGAVFGGEPGHTAQTQGCCHPKSHPGTVIRTQL